MTFYLPMLTNSSITTYRRCPREYKHKYVDLRESAVKHEALEYGTAFHKMLSAWWSCRSSAPLSRLVAALEAMPPVEGPYKEAELRALITGYTSVWGSERYHTIGTDKGFRVELDEHHDLGGSLDGLIEKDGVAYVLEHKTTSQDISPGSRYWNSAVTLDTQVSTYMVAAEKAFGRRVAGTVYDVIRKPSISPMKATQESARKYTKPTKSVPNPRLYAGQRETVETPEDFETRLMSDIGSDPERYFQRQIVVRSHDSAIEHLSDLKVTSKHVAESEEREEWPMHPNACERFSRLCEFHDVCSRVRSLSDSKYRDKERAHEELESGL